MRFPIVLLYLLLICFFSLCRTPDILEVKIIKVEFIDQFQVVIYHNFINLDTEGRYTLKLFDSLDEFQTIENVEGDIVAGMSVLCNKTAL